MFYIDIISYSYPFVNAKYRTKKPPWLKSGWISLLTKGEPHYKMMINYLYLRACSKSFPCGKISKKAEERR